MTKQIDMFEALRPPRAKPRVLMHVSDAGQVHCGDQEDLGKPMCRMRCRRCEHETGWLVFENLTQAKRGIPCPNCSASGDEPPGAWPREAVGRKRRSRPLKHGEPRVSCTGAAANYAARGKGE